MGTNYFLMAEQCKSCAHCPDRQHIGKSSYGWDFLFRGYYDIGSYREWLVELENPKKRIYDEYGRIISLENFRSIVEDRHECMNHYNAIYGTPETYEEKRYRDTRRLDYPLDARDHEAWKDDKDYSFSGREFR